MIKKLLNFRLYSRKKLLLAFEYGAIIAEVAQKQGVEVTPELMKKAEIMIESEFNKKSPTRLAVDTLPNVLSVFELDLSQ